MYLKVEITCYIDNNIANFEINYDKIGLDDT